jgi:HEPN domain-containing protein
MKRPVDLARRFLAVADRDIRTLHLLIAAPESDDQAIGFHAQQAIEKCLKAVLSANQIAFRKTHDLVELLDLLRDEERTLPPNADLLDTLNPFAVTLRYDLFEVEGVDRDWIAKAAAAVRAWAETEVDATLKSETSKAPEDTASEAE